MVSHGLQCKRYIDTDYWMHCRYVNKRFRGEHEETHQQMIVQVQLLIDSQSDVLRARDSCLQTSEILILFYGGESRQIVRLYCPTYDSQSPRSEFPPTTVNFSLPASIVQVSTLETKFTLRLACGTKNGFLWEGQLTLSHSHKNRYSTTTTQYVLPGTECS